MLGSVFFALALLVQFASGQRRLVNVDYLGLGYDVIYGNPQSDGQDPGFRQKIFEFTYDENRVTADGKWLVPDNVQALRTTMCSYSADSTEVHGTQSYQNSLLLDASVDISVWKSSFSASTSYKQVENGTSMYRKSYIVTVAKCTHYKVSIDTYVPFRVSANFAAGVRSLPTVDNDTAYFNFLRTFGTHYLTSMTMGAKAVVKSEFDQVAWTKMKQSGINVQSGATFSFLKLSGDVSLSTEVEKHAGQTFESYRTSHSEYYLGSLPSTDGRWETWAASSGDSPSPISYALHQVNDLFSSSYLPQETEVHLAAKKRILESYYTRYCEKISGCNLPRENPVPVIIEQQAVSIQGTTSVTCRSGYSLLSCGHRNPNKRGRYEVYRYVQPLDQATCRCYDYFGMECVLSCVNTNDVQGYSIQSASGTKFFDVSCPEGSKVLGCHLYPHFRRPELWRRLYPHHNGDACSFYDFYGATGYVTCATNIINYEVRSSYGTKWVVVTCSPGKFVLGCGIRPSGNGAEDGKAERFRDHYVSSVDSCTCYDYYGATCYATCGNFGN